MSKFSSDRPGGGWGWNLESEACRAITAAEVVAVLELLPFGGRMELLVKSLMKSPDMDRLATGLFDWCFADDTAAQSWLL